MRDERIDGLFGFTDQHRQLTRLPQIINGRHRFAIEEQALGSATGHQLSAVAVNAEKTSATEPRPSPGPRHHPASRAQAPDAHRKHRRVLSE
ncbi:hypothetical protein AB8Z38_15575 [Bradyrhizobium sp. LLZ17]|uniref:Uncharacterized protein n=1 Tax=Bradyrhizobium sp. LLZ17 TaxID=3239388 RepID=A0AB39XTY7_9BRAD